MNRSSYFHIHIFKNVPPESVLRSTSFVITNMAGVTLPNVEMLSLIKKKKMFSGFTTYKCKNTDFNCGQQLGSKPSISNVYSDVFMECLYPVQNKKLCSLLNRKHTHLHMVIKSEMDYRLGLY